MHTIMKKHTRALREELNEIEYPELYERLAHAARAADPRVAFLSNRLADVRDGIFRDQRDVLAMGAVCCDDAHDDDAHDEVDTEVAAHQGSVFDLFSHVEYDCIAYVSPEISSTFGLLTGRAEWNACPDMLRIHGVVAEKNLFLQLLTPFLSAIVSILLGCVCFFFSSGGSLTQTADHLFRVILPAVAWYFLEGIVNCPSWSAFMWTVLRVVFYLWSVRNAYLARDKYRVRVRELREETTRALEHLFCKSRLVLQQARAVRAVLDALPPQDRSPALTEFLHRADAWAQKSDVHAFLRLGDRSAGKEHISHALTDADVLALRWKISVYGMNEYDVETSIRRSAPIHFDVAKELDQLTTTAAWIRMWRVLARRLGLRPASGLRPATGLRPESTEKEEETGLRPATGLRPESTEKEEETGLRPAATATATTPNVLLAGARYPESVLQHGKDNTVPANWDSAANDLITGANATGKTTYMKTVMLNLILAHHAGVGFFDRCELAPGFLFSDFRCFVNIPDTSGRDSLFQAEARQARDIMHTWGLRPGTETETEENGCSFTILDEAFTGTRPEDAIRATRALIDYFRETVAPQQHVFMMTTHFTDVATHFAEEKENESTTSVIRCRRTAPGYRIVDGVCARSSVPDVLRELDFPETFLAAWPADV